MKDDLHIGIIIQNKMEEEGRSANWLANKLSCTRQNVYKIYEKSNIDMVQLLNISRALKHNFLKDIYSIFNKSESK